MEDDWRKRLAEEIRKQRAHTPVANPQSLEDLGWELDEIGLSEGDTDFVWNKYDENGDLICSQNSPQFEQDLRSLGA